MKKGVNQWCFREGTTIEQVFAAAARFGYDGVELNMQEPDDAAGLALNRSEREIIRLREMASGLNLELPSVSTGLLWTYALSSPDDATRRKGQDIIRRMIETAALLGADSILVVPGVVTPEVRYDEAYDRSQESLHSVLKDAESANVHIAIENVWNRFLLSPLEMARFIDELGSSHAGAYFDVGNVLQFSFPEQWIRILGSRIRKVHVKDFSLSVGNIHGFVPLLVGDVNWPAVRDALRDIGYEGFMTAELSAYRHAEEQLIADTSVHLDLIIASGRAD